MFLKYKLIDHMYKVIEFEMHTPLPREGDWIVLGKKLYKVSTVWLFNGKAPVVQATPFDYPPPRELIERAPRAKKKRAPAP